MTRLVSLAFIDCTGCGHRYTSKSIGSDGESWHCPRCKMDESGLEVTPVDHYRVRARMFRLKMLTGR